MGQWLWGEQHWAKSCPPINFVSRKISRRELHGLANQRHGDQAGTAESNGGQALQERALRRGGQQGSFGEASA